MNVLPINQIEDKKITRFSTGMVFLDTVLGTNGHALGEREFQAGMAQGSLIMLAGEAGAGKSRLAIEIGTNMNRRGCKILTFQLEVSASDFKSWTNDKVTNAENFLISTERNHKKQIEIINHHKPELVIVDSVNRYDCNYNEVSTLIDELQTCARETGTIVIMIGQLDKKGNKMMVRGSQDWTYLPDVVVNVYREFKTQKEITDSCLAQLRRVASNIGIKIVPEHMSATEHESVNVYRKYMKENAGVFNIGIPEKNRYGKTGGVCRMQHTSDGVSEFHEYNEDNVEEICEK